MAAETRQNLCKKLDLQFHAVKDDYSGSAAVWLAEPEEAGCRAILAEGAANVGSPACSFC